MGLPFSGFSIFSNTSNVSSNTSNEDSVIALCGRAENQKLVTDCSNNPKLPHEIFLFGQKQHELYQSASEGGQLPAVDNNGYTDIKDSNTVQDELWMQRT